MITLPKEFTMVPGCPGYFWHTIDHKLFSIKVAGELRELKVLKYDGPVLYKGRHLSLIPGMVKGALYYRLSVKGRGRYWPVSKLKTLPLVDHEIQPKYRYMKAQ